MDVTSGIAGVDFTLTFEASSVADRWRDHYRAFPPITQTPFRVDVTKPLVQPPVNLSGRVKRVSGRLVVDGAEALGHLNPSALDGEIVPHEGMFVAILLIRAQIGLEALNSGGALLHASSVEKDGGAHVFVGHSGAGKSTIARMLVDEGARLLADDLTVIRRAASGYEVWGTPWGGGCQGPFPLRGVWMLKHGSSSTRTLSRGECLGALARNLSLPIEEDDTTKNALRATKELAWHALGREVTFGLRDRVSDVLERP